VQYPEDLDLAKCLLAGQEASFNRFFNEYYPRVYRFCQRRIDGADAEDIALETLRHAIKRIETYRGEASLLTWLYQVARSQVSAYYKRAQKHRDLVLIEDDTQVQAEVAAMAIDLATGPEALKEREQRRDLVHYMLDSLPGDYGQILEWKYVDQYSVEEIAAKLEVSPTAIQSMLARARNAFRSAYSGIASQMQTNPPIPLRQPRAQE
jgi:RNA polymerase sigma-70 factor (ECF subfamily)